MVGTGCVSYVLYFILEFMQLPSISRVNFIVGCRKFKMIKFRKLGPRTKRKARMLSTCQHLPDLAQNCYRFEVSFPTCSKCVRDMSQNLPDIIRHCRLGISYRNPKAKGCD